MTETSEVLWESDPAKDPGYVVEYRTQHSAGAWVLEERWELEEFFPTENRDSAIEANALDRATDLAHRGAHVRVRWQG